jgi:hypothetical protein
LSASLPRDTIIAADLVWDDGRVAGIRGRGKGGQAVVENARVVVGRDGFVRVFSGITSPAAFFSEENVGRIRQARD